MNGNQERNTIVVADDDGLVRQFVSLVLTKAGFHVIQATGGEQAEELIRTNRSSVALAICDIRMPGLSGLDVAATLSHQKAAFPVLLISGVVDSIAVESILLKNPSAILTKPFTGPELVDRVRALIAAGRSKEVRGRGPGLAVEVTKKNHTIRSPEVCEKTA
jgi:DNA-binding response OmpR family regulator